MNLFIDANIYLNFFFYSPDDLDELPKLEVLLRQRKTTLWLPQQVLDEVTRKREAQVESSLKVLRDQHLDLKFPQICHGNTELEELRELQRKYSLAHDKLVRAVEQNARAKTLKADQVLNSLFRLAKHVPLTDRLLSAARNRMERGNPPGKDRKLGDAINWESLLEVVPISEDLHLITADRDFGSMLDRGRPNPFLEMEWRTLKHSEFRFYGQLTGFLRQHFPSVKLADDLEKAILVERLGASGSFAETHSIVAQLSGYPSFSIAELRELLQAVASNTQVFWIIADSDIYEFVLRILREAQGRVPPELLTQVQALLPEHPGEVDETPHWE